MNIERRLQHAARELREVPIVVPPLSSRRNGGGATLILQALAAPMLFVAGGLFAIGALRDTPTVPVQTDIVGTPVTVDAPDVAPATADPAGEPVRPISAPSVRAELEMIAEIVSSGQSRSVIDEPADTETPPAEPAMPEPDPTGSADAVGPL